MRVVAFAARAIDCCHLGCLDSGRDLEEPRPRHPEPDRRGSRHPTWMSDNRRRVGCCQTGLVRTGQTGAPADSGLVLENAPLERPSQDGTCW
jgi:hypothetical protein